MTLWLRGGMRSRDKSKIKYLFFYKADGHQTWPSGNLWWGKLTHHVRWSSDHVIAWNQVSNLKLNISPSARWPPNMAVWRLIARGNPSMESSILSQCGNVWLRDKLKLDKLVIYGEANVSMKSHISHEVI